MIFRLFLRGWVGGWLGGWLGGWVGGWLGRWVGLWVLKKKLMLTQLSTKLELKLKLKLSLATTLLSIVIGFLFSALSAKGAVCSYCCLSKKIMLFVLPLSFYLNLVFRIAEIYFIYEYSCPVSEQNHSLANFNEIKHFCLKF